MFFQRKNYEIEVKTVTVNHFTNIKQNETVTLISNH